MIDTRFTREFGLTLPIALAPMAHAAGGRLAAAVARAGGLGLIGGGYCNAEWIDAQFELTKNEAVGCGFITWRLAEVPSLLDRVLERKPRAIFLSYGDPRPFSKALTRAGVPLICQVQDLASARQAVEAGAAVIVAQGSAAGGYAAHRATLTLVPELADFIYRTAHDVLLLAAGGIADARGLAASIVMGADGVVLGTRLWASEEALVHPNQIAAALTAGGDDTRRTKNIEQMQGLDWPEPYTARTLTNPIADEHLEADLPANDITVGEGIGIIRDAPPVQDVLDTMARRAERMLIDVSRKVIC